MSFKTIEVSGFKGAIMGMRYPFKGKTKSDSEMVDGHFSIGRKDWELALKLCKAGSEHRKFMQMIQVWVSIDQSRYFWSEADTYRLGIVKNSESTMHTLLKDDEYSVDFPWGISSVADATMNTLLAALSHIAKEARASPEQKKEYLMIIISSK